MGPVQHFYRPPVAASATPLTGEQLAHVRLNVLGDVLDVVTRHGGEMIVSGEQMSAMVEQLADVVLGWTTGDRLADVLRLGP